ncbi:MAG TPA: hypothetical protein ENI97_05350 [Gammaproteobacteria bacterium]|nr:hypothetical protein [Gammaproteobacteria bacterium]
MAYKIFIGMLMFSLQAAFAEPFPLTIIEPFDEGKIVMYVAESDIEQSPAWLPGEGAPPLSIENLIKAIEKYRAGMPRLAEDTVHEIALKPIWHHEKQHRWYYLVQMKSAEGHGHRHYLAVLMSGKIISAIKEPEAYK